MVYSKNHKYGRIRVCQSEKYPANLKEVQTFSRKNKGCEKQFYQSQFAPKVGEEMTDLVPLIFVALIFAPSLGEN